jgi:hypothetical protein
MKLYYTVSSASEAVQSKTHLSLGGFKSSSLLPNSRLGNMFPEITPTTISNFNQNQYIGLVLKNEVGQFVSNITIYFTFPEGCYSKFRIAAVDMILDSNGDLQMEHVDNQFSKPLNATFYEASGSGNAVVVGDLVDGEQLGLWIERELLLSVITAQQSAIYTADPNPIYPGRFIPVVLPKFDEIGVSISYDIV